MENRKLVGEWYGVVSFSAWASVKEDGCYSHVKGMRADEYNRQN